MLNTAICLTCHLADPIPGKSRLGSAAGGSKIQKTRLHSKVTLCECERSNKLHIFQCRGQGIQGLDRIGGTSLCVRLMPPIRLLLFGICAFSGLTYFTISHGCASLQDSPRLRSFYRTFSIAFFVCFMASQLFPTLLPFGVARVFCAVVSPYFLYLSNLLFRSSPST
jgi:hypothetical protein